MFRSWILLSSVLALFTAAPRPARADACESAMTCVLGGVSPALFGEFCSVACASAGSVSDSIARLLTAPNFTSACTHAVAVVAGIGGVKGIMKDALQSLACAFDPRGLCRSDHTGQCQAAMEKACKPETLGREVAKRVCDRLSYPRGAGSPLRCGDGMENVGGLCYPPCQAPFNGRSDQVRCYERCDDGFTDMGLTCHRPMHSYGKSSLTRRCRDGYRNDGLICTRPPATRSKAFRARPTGRPLTSCADGQEKDGGLCYPRCLPGFRGEGPVCWKR